MLSSKEAVFCKQVLDELTYHGKGSKNSKQNRSSKRMKEVTDLLKSFRNAVKPLYPDEQDYYQAMKGPASQVVDPAKTTLRGKPEQADPWIIAQAFTLTRKGHKVEVVTADHRPKPGNTYISLTAACELVDIDWSLVQGFVSKTGIWPGAPICTCPTCRSNSKWTNLL